MRFASLAVAAAVATTLAASVVPAAAAEPCTRAPKATWQPADAAKAKAVELGYVPSKVKEEDACWEVYAKAANGDRFELFFNPVSIELVRKKAN